MKEQNWNIEKKAVVAVVVAGIETLIEKFRTHAISARGLCAHLRNTAP